MEIESSERADYTKGHEKNAGRHSRSLTLRGFMVECIGFS